MRREAGRVAWAFAVLAVGTATFLPAYGRGGPAVAVVLVLLAALVLPLTLVLLGRRLAVAPWLVAFTATSFIGVAALTVLRAQEPAIASGAWRTTPAGRAFGPLADSVAQLLTAPRPAPVEPALLVPVAVLVALVALGVGLALRSRRAVLAPLVGATVLYVAALLVTAGAADPHGLHAALLVAVSAVGWVLLDGDASPVTTRPAAELGRPEGRPHRTWPSPTTTFGAAVVVGAVAVVGAGVTGGEPFEPREHVDPPTVDLPTGHPLSHLPAWIAQGDTEMFRVRSATGDAAAVPERMALVVLPDFDGATWRADLALRPVGAVATPALPNGDRQGRLELDVTVTALRDASHGVGDWLPTAGVAQSVDVPAVQDVDTGSLLGTSGASAYRVVADLDQPDTTVVTAAAVPAGPEVERYLAVPRLPADLAELATVTTADAASRWEQATALRDAVREGRDLAPDAITGSSYARLQEFLGADRAEGGQVGSAEQFAGAFAVLARSVGIPTRLVVGFTLGPSAAEEDVAAGTVVVRGRDAHAWPEVYLAGAGWVPVDPSPAHRSDDSGRGAGTRELPDAEDEAELDDEVIEEEGEEVPPLVEGDEQAGGDDVVPVVAILLASVVALALLAGLVLLALRRRRAVRWRHRGAPGAWQHVEDGLLLAGHQPPADAPAPAIAAGLGADVVLLAGRAEAAAYAPAPAATGPTTGRRRTVRGADDATDWTVAVRCVRALRRGAPWHRRLRWSIDPAPLRRHRLVSGGRR